MKAINISLFRKNLKKYIDSVTENNETLIIPRNKEENAVVILSMETYNALTETDYLLSSEANRNRLMESMEQAKEGKTVKVKQSKLKTSDVIKKASKNSEESE